MHRIEPSPSRNAAFRLTPDLRFLFAYPAHEQAFAKLRKGIEAGNRLLLLTGCFGVGKTLLLRRLAAELAKAGISSSYAALPHLDLAGLLSGKADQGPQWEAADQRHVFLIDDADRSSHGFLQQLDAHLSSPPTGSRVVQFVLASGSGFRDQLTSNFPSIGRSLAVHAQIEPLNGPEATEYIRHRLNVSGAADVELTADAIEAISNSSGGVPRLINHICSRALLLAGPSQLLISREIATEAIDDYRTNVSFGQSPGGALFSPVRLPSDEAKPSPERAAVPPGRKADSDRLAACEAKNAKAIDIAEDRAAVSYENPAPGPNGNAETPIVTPQDRNSEPASLDVPLAPVFFPSTNERNPGVPIPTEADVVIPPQPSSEKPVQSERKTARRPGTRPGQRLHLLRHAADDRPRPPASSAPPPKFAGFRERRAVSQKALPKPVPSESASVSHRSRRGGRAIWLTIPLIAAAVLAISQQAHLKIIIAEYALGVAAALTDAWAAFSTEVGAIMGKVRTAVDRWIG